MTSDPFSFMRTKPIEDPAPNFRVWYARLIKGTPKMESPKITLTADNFRRALRQAYIAGWEERGL